jgi:hypothetical protein
MTFDQSALSARMKELAQSSHFYKLGCRLLVEQYNISQFFDVETFRHHFDELSPSFAETMCSGKMPTEDEVFREDNCAMDHFIQTALCLIGLSTGIITLDRMNCEVYSNSLRELQKQQDSFDIVYGFGILTLVQGMPPSDLQLMMTFRNEDFTVDERMEVIADLCRDHIATYERHLAEIEPN